jgi:hypothetical protein
VVSAEFKGAFRKTFESIFEMYPLSRENYLDYSRYVRQQAGESAEQIVVLDFDSGVKLIDPGSEQIFPAKYQDLGTFGPFEVTRELRFPDEINLDEDIQSS